MAISPVSDLVLDVAKAADPEKVKAAQTKLAAGGSDASAFSDTLQALKSPASVSQNSAMFIKTPTAATSSVSRLSLTQKFEAQVLKSFIETMLPKDAENSFGSGYAGDVAKTFMAEVMANQIAAHGGIGIAKQIDHAIALRKGSTIKPPPAQES